MDLGLKSKKALVFGGSSGLGLAAARSLAAEGAEIFLISRDQKKLNGARDEIKKDFGVSCEYACYDMTNSDEIDNFINNIKSSDFNILINNTGGPPPSNTSNTKSDYWEKYINSIILNTIKVTDNLLDYMKKKAWEQCADAIINIEIGETTRESGISFVEETEEVYRSKMYRGIAVNIYEDSTFFKKY